MTLFGRQAYLLIGAPGKSAKRIEGLRIDFRIEHVIKRRLNKGSLKIYNPDTQFVSLASQPDTLIQLYVGYDRPGLILQGNPVVKSVRDEPGDVDRILHVPVLDGKRAYETARVSVCFPEPVKLSKVMDRALTALSLPRAAIRLSSDPTLPEYCFEGSAADLLDQLLVMVDTEWSIRDGAVQVLGKETPTGESVLVFSENARNVKTITTKGKGSEIHALLNPAMRPGRRYVVEKRDGSRQVYKTRSVMFEGETLGYDDMFDMVIKGREV